MLDSDYKKQIARLQDCFGEKKFPPEMVRTMWYRLKAFNEKVFEMAIDTLVCEAKFPPKLSEIIDHCNQAKSRIAKRVENRPDCLDCDGNGIIFCVSKENGCEYSFRCIMCDIPEFAGIPGWATNLTEKFDRIAKVY